mmetsp:Transcript_101571/g.313372  ORF Transcript_101571/g.313372 Transcript_101571/m.313372 type:complete len:264 (-) Transcript_101571:631-1422(-)
MGARGSHGRGDTHERPGCSHAKRRPRDHGRRPPELRTRHLLQLLRQGRATGRPDPVLSTCHVVSPCFLEKLLPAHMVLRNQAQGGAHVVDCEVQGGLILAATALEVIDPLEALIDAARSEAVDVVDRPSVCKRLTDVDIHREDLPVSLTLVNEAHRPEGSAAHHLANPCYPRGEVQDVQGVVVPGSAAELVSVLRVAERLREATVVEGHRPAECCKAAGALGVLLHPVLRQVRLDLELLETTPRHFVHVVVEACVLIKPALHV